MTLRKMQAVAKPHCKLNLLGLRGAVTAAVDGGRGRPFPVVVDVVSGLAAGGRRLLFSPLDIL